MGIEEFFGHSSFRPGQEELALRVHDGCARGEVLALEAMSGFGKTAAVLSGVLSAAEEQGLRVVYACRTKRQIFRVTEELSLLQSRRQFKAGALTSKFDYCLLKAANNRRVPQQSFPWYCGFNVSNNLCSYFLNLSLLGEELDAAVRRLSLSVPSHAELMRRGEELHACPYELSRLALMEAKVIVVPYQYVFDRESKRVLFDRISVDEAKTILVVDEAHNLREFMRSTHSASISPDDVSAAVAEAEELLMAGAAASLKAVGEGVREALAAPTGWFLDRRSFAAQLGRGKEKVWLQNLVFELTACSEAAWSSVALGRRLPFFILKVGAFLGLLLSGPDDLVLTKGDGALGLVSAQPSKELAAALKLFRSSVLVSATINPSEVFLSSLGINGLGPQVYTATTSSLVTVRTFVDLAVTTRYKSRTPEMYAKIADRIAAIVGSIEGGVGVFPPSYAVLDPLFELVSKRVSGRPLLREKRGFLAHEADSTIASFNFQAGSVLFGVQGGRFSEGEDFKGGSMDATVVVGLSLPPPSPQLYAEYAYLKRNGETNSYLMLALLPALRKAFQAAGRHIRNPGKKGLVFMLDKRFGSATVSSLMPSWLKADISMGDFDSEKIRHEASAFWADRPAEPPASLS